MSGEGEGRRVGNAKRSGLVTACVLAFTAACLLVACGGDTGDSGVRVVVTFAPPTATSPPRSLTQPASLPTVTPVAFSTDVPTITNIGSTQLMAGVKAKVKDSADGTNLREMPSTSAKVLTSLAAGAVVNVLADPTNTGGRTWVKVSYNGFEGFVATEFVERTA